MGAMVAPTDMNNGGAPMAAPPPEAQLTTLPNGLTIIVREDHSAPVVSVQAWCRTGSIHEGEWLGAGLSHIIEHMLFKGTANRPGYRIDQEVQEAGGHMNAYTSFDRTVFHIDVPSTGARVAVDILCDIVQHASFPEAEMAKELEVIRREIDMGVDDPSRRSSRRLFETAYTLSPYRHTIIGYSDIFSELKRDDIVGYYRRRYVPGNLFIVVVGDVRAQDIVSQIRDAFANNKAKPIPTDWLPLEPRQTAPREVIEEAPVELSQLHLAWHIPDVRHPDQPALDVLATLLGSGRSSRLYQSVREKQGLVVSADAWTYTPQGTGLFGLSATIEPDKLEAAKVAILAEVETLRREPPTADELRKVVKQFVAGTLGSRKTMDGQAAMLGSSWISAQDLNFADSYVAAVRLVVPADVLRVAQTYLSPGNRTLYALMPEGRAPKVNYAVTTTTDHPAHMLTLTNGLRILLKEDHRLPFVQFRAIFRGGVLAETVRNSGASKLMTNLLVKGTQRRTGHQIANEIESVGGSIDSYSAYNTFGITAEVMRDDFNLALDIVADTLLNSTFPQQAFDRQRDVQVAALRDQRDHLLHSASIAMRRAMFGERGYGLNPLGREEVVSRLQTSDLGVLYRQLVVPNNCVFAVFGNINSAETRLAVEHAFGSWESGVGLPEHPHAVPAHGQIRAEETRDKEQAVVVMGFPGCTVSSRDRFLLEVLAEACSDLGSRLFLRIREELGLAYYVGAQHIPGLSPGTISFYAGTAAKHCEQVEHELAAEIEKLRANGLTAEELVRAKAKMIGQRKIGRQDLGAQANIMALDELYGLGFENSLHEDALFESVTLEQVLQAARQYLRRELMVTSVIKPAAK
ncbi:MAG: insulinase family protein [Pedosphaera sp.]|nr:insulinase family protein [Pedosphaera sp.]